MSRVSLADRLLPRAFSQDLDQILNQFNNKVYSANKVIPRDCSPKTRRERRNNLRRAFAELYFLNYRLASPRGLKQKHVQALTSYWSQKGLASKTLHGLISNLREFARWIGKRGVVTDVGDYFGGREDLVRSVATSVDHSWESRGVDFCALFEQAKNLDLRFQIYLRLQRFFGLRVKESIEFRPWLACAMDDDHILVSHGTKGGKQRIVKIRNDNQRQVLADAKTMVGSSRNCRLRWLDMTWQQAQAHFYYLMRRIGATHKLRDISAHGLRHAFLQDEYQIYAKVPSAIKSAGVLPRSRQEHQRAMLAVSLQAGHYRPSISGGYCGSFGHQLRSIPDSNDQ